VRRVREQVVERVELRAVRGGQLVNLAVLVPVRRANLGDEARSTDRRNVVADRAACRIKGGTETLFRRLHLHEIVEPRERRTRRNGKRVPNFGPFTCAGAIATDDKQQRAPATLTVPCRLLRTRSRLHAMTPRYVGPHTWEHSNV
jgi:hypothetical protein